MKISPGAIVVFRQTGLVAWVVHSRLADGRFKCVSEGVDPRGNGAVFNGRVVGEGDLMVVMPAPSYAVGDAIEQDGKSLIVAADLGDAVECVVPSHSHQLRGGMTYRNGTRRGGCVRLPGPRTGATLHIPGGNRVTLAKSDITLERLR